MLGIKQGLIDDLESTVLVPLSLHVYSPPYCHLHLQGKSTYILAHRGTIVSHHVNSTRGFAQRATFAARYTLAQEGQTEQKSVK